MHTSNGQDVGKLGLRTVVRNSPEHRFSLCRRRNDILGDKRRHIGDPRVAELGIRTAETASVLDQDHGRGVR